MVVIYKLVDPRDPLEIPQYVGKTVDVNQRLKSHISKPHSNGLRRWVLMLKRSGLHPKLIVLRTVSDSDWSLAEREEVKKAKENNSELMNIAEGGLADGPPHDLAVRLGRRIARVAFKRDPEGCRERYRISGEILRRYSKTQEGRAAASIRGRNNILKSIVTMREKYYGSPEHLKHCSSAGRKGIRVSRCVLLEGYWKSSKALVDRAKAGRLRAIFTNHKRWHVERNRIVESCPLCVGTK